MYKIKYYESAKKDIDDILLYISQTLNNPSAALKLLKEFKRADKIIILFPHGILKYNNEFDYYIHKVKNYYFYYKIDEIGKIITIVRVLYKSRNFESLINDECNK